MRDKIHQPYRQALIPGLAAILSSMTPTTHQGLLGICLSGAGPTILALATHNFRGIAEVIVERFAREGIRCEWRVLEPAEEGAVVVEEEQEGEGEKEGEKEEEEEEEEVVVVA